MSAAALARARASASAEYESMTSSDVLDAAYDNGLACKAMLGAWKAQCQLISQAERAAAPPELLDLPYGQGTKDERIDFFPAATGAATAPTLLYLHGGYWHMDNPKTNNAFIAVALRKAGVNVAIVEYAGLPNPEPSPLSVQCTQVLAAVDFVASGLASQQLPGDPKKLVVAGHSAGGHLTGVCALHPATRGKLAGALCISMISDLEPLRRHSYFNLSLAEAGRRLIEPQDVEAWSPLALIPPADADAALPPIVAAVGGDELPELVRQARDLHAACAAQGHHRVTPLVVEGKSHFDVLDGLAQGDGPLFAHACALLGTSVND